MKYSLHNTHFRISWGPAIKDSSLLGNLTEIQNNVGLSILVCDFYDVENDYFIQAFIFTYSVPYFPFHFMH